MKEQERDNSLRRALQRQNSKIKLSTNFTYATMLRVQKAAVEREKRENRILFFAAIVATLLLIGGCAYIIAPTIENYTYSFSLWEYARETSINMDTIKFYTPIFIAIILLLLLDIKLRAIFKKKLNQ